MHTAILKLSEGRLDRLADLVAGAKRDYRDVLIVLLARQLGCRLPAEVTAGLWQWSKRAKEGRA